MAGMLLAFPGIDADLLGASEMCTGELSHPIPEVVRDAELITA